LKQAPGLRIKGKEERVKTAGFKDSRTQGVECNMPGARVLKYRVLEPYSLAPLHA